MKLMVVKIIEPNQNWMHKIQINIVSLNDSVSITKSNKTRKKSEKYATTLEIE